MDTTRHPADVEAADGAVDMLRGRLGDAARAEPVRAERTLSVERVVEDALKD